MENHEEHHHPPYKFIFMILIACTGLSWIADELKDIFPGPGWLAVTVLAIAAMKASCVMLYFMHLRFERHWKYVLLAPTFILAVGLPLALFPDVAVHYYDVDVPQNPVKNGPAGNFHGEAADGEAADGEAADGEAADGEAADGDDSSASSHH